MKLLFAPLFASATLCGAIATAAPAKAPTSAKTPAPTPASTPAPSSSPSPAPAPAPAPAAKPAAPPSPAAPAPALTPSAEVPEDDFGHAHQFNFRTEFFTGYRMQLRYDKSPRCAPYNYAKPQTDQQKFCGYGAAPGLGIALGFSLIDSFEPFAFMRFGLSDEASQTNTGKMLQVGAGARLYTMSDSRFKIFFSPWLGVDLSPGPVQPRPGTGQGSPGTDDDANHANVSAEAFRTDLLVHLDIGPQYDFSKGFGVYLSGGLTFQMLRYLGASADLAIGVQLRAP